MSAAEKDPPVEWDGTGAAPDETPPDLLEQWDSPASGEAPARPVVKIVVGELPRMIRETIRALGEGDPNLYQRANTLVRVIREPTRREAYEADARHGAEMHMRPGTPRMVDASGVLMEQCATVAKWIKFDARRGQKVDGKIAGEWVGANPCAMTVGAIEKRKQWPGIRPIRGIAETPYLAPSGRIVQAPGWDEETNVVLLPSVNIGPIDVSPTQDQSRAALRYLWTRLACDFPFRGLGEANNATDPTRALQFAKAVEIPDAFVGLTMLLTIFARLGITGAVPSGVFEAAGQGSGKSLQIHTIAMVATSRAASVATFPTREGKPDEQELEKVIMGYAMAGARIVAFDNIRGLLAGATLERAQTAVDSIDGRILGATGQTSLPWMAALMFSGNNMAMSDDVAQRSLVSRIESGREDPRARPRKDFLYPNLLAAVQNDRARMVRAALVILRAYLAAKEAGVDVPVMSRGSFEAWAAIVPGAIRYAGGPDMLRAFPEAGRGGDEEGEAHLCLMRWWRDEWQGQRASVILEALFRGEPKRGHEQEGPADMLDEARAAARALTRTKEGQPPSPHAFGLKLRGLRGKIRGGMRFDADEDKKTGTALWRVLRVEGT